MVMRLKRRATVAWRGTVTEGGGTIALGSGAFRGPYTLHGRVEDVRTTNPEELIGAGHAGCFTMSVADLLTELGHPAELLTTTATVDLAQRDASRWDIARITLDLEGYVPGIDERRFAAVAEQAKATCPVSRALAATPIVVNVRWAAPDAATQG